MTATTDQARSTNDNAEATFVGDWQSAFAHYNQVNEELAAYLRDVWSPAEQREQSATGDGAPSCRAPDEEGDRLAGVQGDAAATLMGIPAPDEQALRWKLDYMMEVESGDDETGEYMAAWSLSFLEQLRLDIARFLPVFA